MGNMDFTTKDFINRELSFLEFNGRVLEEARDKSNPLMERIKFAGIVTSNLDEFYMIRYGTLSDQIQAKIFKTDPTGRTPREQTRDINERTRSLLKDLYHAYRKELRPELKEAGVTFVDVEELTEEDRTYLNKHFVENIYPVITPMVIDSSRPFPLVSTNTLNIAVLLKDKKQTGKHHVGTIQVPSVIERYHLLPGSEKLNRRFILLEDLMKMMLRELFNAFEVANYSCYRITRNADLEYNEEEAEDLLAVIKETIKQRRWGNVIKLEVEESISRELLVYLIEEFEITEDNVFKVSGPMDFRYFFQLSNLQGYDEHRFKEIIPLPVPELLQNEDIFACIRHRDIVLHHPYDSFASLIKLVNTAAQDPDVLAIKQTLYRVSGQSPIVKALADAAENGKQVTVLVELKARFDEENNINWALRLEKAGCHVIYGVVGLKTHCKAILIVRRENNEIKRYFHVGTGNYNDVTAKLYTDVGLLSCNQQLSMDISDMFNRLSGQYQYQELRLASLAPESMRNRFNALIHRERELARSGKKGLIIAKMNSLVDRKIIEELYEASRDGVEINLIIRGVCCLRPGVKGLSENIKVYSIVGRFLEHSRILYFHNDGNEDFYITSADWMERNLNNRIELMVPVLDKEARQKLKNILEYNLKDNVKARLLRSDGTYQRVTVKDKDAAFSSQDELILRTRKKFDKYKKRLNKQRLT